jgi:hypothetical protein
MFATLLIALHFGASAGDASACSTALQQDVDQDGETCLSALQVNKAKSEQIQQEGSQKAIQRHVSEEEATSLRENETQDDAAESDYVQMPGSQYPPTCWVKYTSYGCQPQVNQAGGYDAHPTLDRAKYECACSHSCVGVYMNPQPWTSGQAGQYYVCTGAMVVYEQASPDEVVYFKGPSIGCTYWSGSQPGASPSSGCEVTAGNYYPTQAPMLPPMPSGTCGYTPSHTEAGIMYWPGCPHCCPHSQSCSCFDEDTYYVECC